MTPSIHLLADKPEATSPIAEWLFKEWGHLRKETSSEGAMTRMNARLNRDKIPIALVAYIDDKLVGTVSLIENDMSIRPKFNPWLASLFVASEARNQGIGSALIKNLLDRASKLHIPKLYLFTPDQQKFYMNLGWETVEQVEYRQQQVTILSKEVKMIPS
jgi:N-acetylglutamate synthase-like GNAT family acetyltransferase